MDHTRMIGLLDGLFPFGKKSKTQENQIDLAALSGVSQAISGGAVAPIAAPFTTGVAKYLNSLPVDSSVSKYLKKQDRTPVTGVAKYLVKQAQDSRDNPVLTRVAKYLVTIERNKPAASSVAKYMAQQLVISQQKKPASGVARYLTELEKAEKDLTQLTGVAKYQAEQSRMTRRAEAQKLIDKYKQEEAQMAIERAVKDTQIEQPVELSSVPEVTAATGVGRYLQQQDQIQSSKPPVSGVAKYLARQIVLDSKKPPLSGVQKYLSKHLVYQAKPVVTSVAKYLEVEEQKDRERPVVSGVSKYLTKKALLSEKVPDKSSVAKYLLKQSQAVQNRADANPNNEKSTGITETGVSRYLKESLSPEAGDQLNSIVEKCLEGEFIPASEAADHAVEVKEIKQSLKKNSSAKAKATGVSKYLDEHAVKEKKKKSTKRTGVEKYLIDLEAS